MSSPWTLRDALRPGLLAVHRFYRVFLFFQAIAIGLYFSYYHIPSVQASVDIFATWKASGGIFLSALLTALAGTLLPESVRTVVGPDRTWSPDRLRKLGWNFLFFGFNGLLVDLFYLFQAFMFGVGAKWQVVLPKIAFDFFCFIPLVALPMSVSYFLWLELGWGPLRILRSWNWPPLSGPRTSAPFSRLHVLGTHPSLSLRPTHEPTDSLLSFGFFRLEPGIRVYRISRVARERITHHFHFHSFSEPIRLQSMLRLCFLLPLLATALSSCTPKSKVARENHPLPAGVDTSKQEIGRQGGVFIDSTPGEPSTFNPLVSEDATSSGFIGLFLDSLVHNNPVTQEVEPGLATRWEIATDNKTFTFHLRKGVCWSDGHPLPLMMSSSPFKQSMTHASQIVRPLTSPSMERNLRSRKSTISPSV